MEQASGRWGFIPLAINLIPGTQPGFHRSTIPGGAFLVMLALWLRARRRAQATPAA